MHVVATPGFASFPRGLSCALSDTYTRRGLRRWYRTVLVEGARERERASRVGDYFWFRRRCNTGTRFGSIWGKRGCVGRRMYSRWNRVWLDLAALGRFLCRGRDHRSIVRAESD